MKLEPQGLPPNPEHVSGVLPRVVAQITRKSDGKQVVVVEIPGADEVGANCHYINQEPEHRGSE